MPNRRLLIACALMACLAGPAEAGSVVRVETAPAGCRLIRDGKPYVIKGVGGDRRFDLLAQLGGNSIRTWGAENAGKILDEAQQHGLTVTLGIWLGHERQGFAYNDAVQVAKQLEMARGVILKYRDHPALLMWGLGNEMEGERGDNAAIWSAVNTLASLCKQLDPNHPTMTVIAEVGGDKVKNLHTLCPDIDVVGINSYAGAASLPARYRAAGGTKPYVLTEFGPPGQWEVGKTPWGAAPEPTSTAKADAYRNTYTKAVAGQPLCLGSYAFLWGNKQETTATWFGLFLPTGERTGAVDALAELWSGKAPADRCPTIEPIKVDGPAEVDPGATVRAELSAKDPEGEPLKVEWTLQREADAYGAGGDAEAAPPTLPKAFREADARHAVVTMPGDGGAYRLFAFIRDGHGGAATANVPLRVKGPVTAPPARTAKLPLVVYEDGDKPQPYVPTGWMGNTKAIALETNSADAPHAGKTCLRVDYKDEDEWGGVVWQSPPNDWGDAPGGFDLTGAKRLAFWARGAEGGEVVSFEFGLLGPDKKFPDSARGKLDKVTLSKDWTRYTIDLKGKDLARIKTGFCWVVAADGRPVTFYLDDIRYE